MNAADPRHGTNPGYLAGCRHGCCKGAHAAYRADLRKRQYLNRGGVMVNGTGTRRRIRALVALGWSLRQLDLRLGQRPSYCHRLISDHGPVTPATAAKVAALFAVISHDGPSVKTADEQRNATRSRSIARRHGWPAPELWLDIDDPDERPDPGYRSRMDADECDPVVVDRILAGDYTLARSATRAERVQVVARWTGTTNALEERTGWQPQRYRSEVAS